MTFKNYNDKPEFGLPLHENMTIKRVCSPFFPLARSVLFSSQWLSQLLV
jgi:hypothetical protein